MSAQQETEPRGLVARQGAVRLLSAVLDRGRMLDEAGLEGTPAERAEAHGLADLALRRLGQIDAVLAQLLDRTPKPPVRHILRIMTAELVFADRAAHAAVDMAVRQVKQGKTARMAGLVNAVGRRIAADGAVIVAGQDAARLDTPRWLWERLKADWGSRTARAVTEAHLRPAPLDLTVADARAVPGMAARLGADVLPTGTLRLPGRPQISAMPGYSDGAWWAQDAAAALPARMLGDVRGKRVLDLCAAPGGKTLQLAAAGAMVTALDLSKSRMMRLGENIARTGLEAEAVVADALDWQPQVPFDAILLDAPCSATGTIRRHPDLVHRWDPAGLGELTALQARLIHRAFGWLVPGGDMVFATCSLFRAEGEEQADAFLARTPAALSVAPDDPALAPFLDARGRLRTRPDLWAERGGLDGFFAVRLRRSQTL